MRRVPPSFGFLLTFVIVPSLLIFGQSSGLLPGPGPRAAAGVEIPATAPQAFAAGVARFEEQRYADAVELLSAAGDLPGEVDPRAQVFYLEAAKLRLATTRGDADAQRLARLALQGLAEQAMDDWGARAVREMILGGFGAESDVGRLLGQALDRWEQSADVPAATAEYVDLYRALLDPARRWQNVQAPLLRMWENLVAADAPQEDLLEIGSLVLEGRPLAVPLPRPGGGIGRHPRRHRATSPAGLGSDGAQLVARVAKDILAMAPPEWLAASAHFQLGEQAEQAGRYAEARARYEAAIEAADPADSWAVESARQRLEELTRPRVDIGGELLYQPGSHHAFSLSWRNLASWTLEVHRVDPHEDWVFPRDRRAPRRALEDFLPSVAGVRVSGMSREDEDELRSREPGPEGGAPEPHVPRHDRVWLDPLDPGVYLATVTGKAVDGDPDVAPARFAFQVTDLGMTFQRVDARDGSGDELELWIVDMARGEPIEGARLVVHAAIQAGDSLQWSSTALTTGSDGLIRTELPAERLLGSLVTGEVEGRPVVALDFQVPRRPGAEETWRGFVLSDRPLYRPGETVHLQAFLRQRDLRERRSVVPSTRDVEVLVRAPDGSEFLRRTFELDDNGALETTLEVPERPALGRYDVQIRLPEQSRWVAGGSFQVDEYRLPEFVVRAGLDSEKRYVLGDTLSVEVEAEYLFGGPVRGTAEVVVTRRPLWIIQPPWVRFDWLREEKISPFPQWGYEGEEVVRVTQPLDAEGRVVITVPTSARESDPQDYIYTIEARVTDASRREESTQATARVTRQELYAFLTPERYVVAPGDEARLRLSVHDAMDRAAEVAGRWTVSRQEKEGEPTELFARNTQTGPEGEVTLAFTPTTAGYYHVQFETRDARGNEVTAASTVWCADPQTTRITHAAGALQLIAERDEFIEDDVARVLLVSDTAGASVYLSHHFAGHVETRVVRMEGTVQLLEIPLDRLHRPYFYLRAVRARDFRLHQASARVVAPLGEQALDVTVAFGQDAYEPGASADLRIRAVDALGDPVAAPVTVAVIDEAVLAILPRGLPDPGEVFNRYDTPHPGDLQSSAHRFGGYRLYEKPEEAGEGPVGQAGGDRDDIRLKSRRALGNELRAQIPVETEEALAFADTAERMPAKGEPAAPAPGLGGPAAETTVRTDFRTTALWRTAVMTDLDGTATVEVPLAESLTRWQALAVAITPDSKAGLGTGQTRTRKDVMVRLSHPRVFRERDRFLFAATVHNETDEDLGCRVSLEVEGLTVEGESRTIDVAAHEQGQVEWWAEVPPGSAALDFAYDDRSKRILIVPSEARVKVTAQTRLDSDAFERTVNLLAHGTDLRVVASGEVTSGTATLEFTVPPDRLHTAEVATLTLSPSVLSACIDALPFLAEYPYGCTEQTLSRFVPAVAVRHVVEGLDVSSDRIDPELDAKLEKGLRRIADFQHPDGGWGWWKEDETDPYMTAYVLVALSRAGESGVDVDGGMLRRGREALRKLLPRLEQRPDDMAYALFALSCADRVLRAGGGVSQDETMQRHADDLYQRRDRLSDYARSLLATYLHRAGSPDEALLVLQNLDNTVQVDSEYDTAHWGRVRGYWWRGEGAVESTAFALAAYGEIAPDHPRYRQAARWLVTNREGARWSNTRATAHVVYALVDFARDTEELAGEYVVVARLDGIEVARLEVSPESMVDGGGQFEVPAELMRDGLNQLQLDLDGEGICYATVSVQTFTRTEGPEPTQHHLAVRREVLRLRPLRTLGGSIQQIEETLEDGDAVESGDRIRVKLHLTAHNDLEYLAIEDPRPAGCEPIDQLSGWFWGEGVGGRREIRDELTAFFLGGLSQGDHVLQYELRAESPGTYHVMPTRAYAMYVPDVNGSSGEFHIQIARTQEDEEDSGAR